MDEDRFDQGSLKEQRPQSHDREMFDRKTFSFLRFILCPSVSEDDVSIGEAVEDGDC